MSVPSVYLAGVLAIASCATPPPPSEEAATASVDSSSSNTWDVVCVSFGPESTSADSAAPLLRAVADLWSAERASFQAYQSTYCDDCAMFEGSAAEFFRSSSGLVKRATERFPTSAAAACAEGMMHFRSASLGEGRLDEQSVERAIAAFRRALTLNPSAELQERVRSEIADLESMQPRR